MKDNPRITASLTARQWELVANAVNLRKHALRERARTGDHQAGHMADEYAELSNETDRISLAIERELIAA